MNPLAHRHPHTRRVGLMTVLLACTPWSYSHLLSAQVATPTPISSQAPSLSKEQLKSLDKENRNLYKRCTEDISPNADLKTQRSIAKMGGNSAVSGACRVLSTDIAYKLHDEPNAHLALQRSCALGDQMGCDDLATVLAKAGNIAAARTIWSNCWDKRCTIALFESYANALPPDITLATKVGLPLCDSGADDICDRLKQIGARADFQTIAFNHWQAKVSRLTEEIKAAETDALSEDQQAAQMDEVKKQAEAGMQNSTLGVLSALGAGSAALGGAHERDKAQANRERARSLRAELERMNASQPAAPTASTASTIPLQAADTSSPIQETAAEGIANNNAIAARNAAIKAQQAASTATSAYQACEAKLSAQLASADPHKASKATNYDPCAQYSH